MKSRLQHLLVTLSPCFLVLLVIATTWKLTLGDRIIARGDLLLYFYPLRDYASQAVRELRLPLWNPYTFMGAPFLANSQAGFFYPFNVLTAWLPVERAVSWNIALHLAIAALGAYALARRGFALGRLAAFAGAVTFGLGGYLGAQVEHLNQLQVLAWLPLSVLTICDWRFSISSGEPNVNDWLKRTCGLTVLIALMMTAGHTQSLYISLVTLGLVAVTQSVIGLFENRLSLDAPLLLRSFAPLLLIALAAVLAVMICGVQLLPTLELSGESARAGGLPFNEAASFSWRPWVVARALMPTYGDPLFAEYVAYLGASGLALALPAVVAPSPQPSPDGRRSRLIALILTIAGFILALGVATPLFNALYRFLPGFNLFRAQARWLVVFALGAALLVGLGVQRLQHGVNTGQARNWLFAWLALIGLLIAGVMIGARLSPEPEYRALPEHSVMVGWIVALGTMTVLIVINWLLVNRQCIPITNHQLPVAPLFAAALALELLAASQFQPYSRAADRQALTSLRPATAHLLADALPSLEREGGGGGGRVLALSSLFFDPGDKVEQEMIYRSQLSADELYDRIIASKYKEVLSPNLSLYYRIPSVDGYDGGLLPTRRYAEFVKQFASTPSSALDGRLREFLRGVPASQWLEQMAVRYLIADKTQDVFIDGVYHDLLFSEPISETLSIPLSPFQSTALGLVLSAEGRQVGDVIASADVAFDDGSIETFDVRASEPITPYFGVRLQWQPRKTPLVLTIRSLGAAGSLALRGLTSIDETDGVFLAQMVAGDHIMHVVHSGDVKIYENLRPAPRAALRYGENSPVEIRQYGGQIIEDKPEFIRIQLPEMFGNRLPNEPLSQVWPSAQLILRDACYPGWVARVDGVETPIQCVDTLFRAIELPGNAREVTFSYEPQSVWMGALLSTMGIAFWVLLLAVYFFMRGSSASRSPSPKKVNEMTSTETTAATESRKPGWLPMIE